MELTPELKAQLIHLKQRKADLLSVVASVDDAIRLLEGNTEKPKDWKNSAEDCIKVNKHPMRTVDILRCMIKKDKTMIGDQIKRRNYIAALSIALNNQCDKNVLGRLQIPGYKGYFYGLKVWFVDEHTLLKTVNDTLLYELYYNKYSVFNLDDNGEYRIK
jgi:hypothetical protein